MIMTDQMLSEAATLESEAATALKTQLEAKGYKVRIATPQEIAKTAGLAAVVRKVNTRYEEEWSKLVSAIAAATAEAVKLCAMLRADGVVVTRMVAVGVSKGKATMRAIFGSNAPHSYARIDFGVVEGRQGFIEGYFIGYENTSLSQLTKKPARHGPGVRERPEALPARRRRSASSRGDGAGGAGRRGRRRPGRRLRGAPQ
jgi:hypothetical protein